MSEFELWKLAGYSDCHAAIICIIFSAIWAIAFAFYKSDVKKQIENLKAQNEKRNYISRVQFDAEFKTYQELAEYCYYMFFNVSQLFPKGIAEKPADPEEQQKYINTLYNNALKALVDFQNILYKYGAFITEDLYKIFDDFRVKNQAQVNMYKNINIADIEAVRADFRKNFHSECIKRTEEIYNDYDNITIELRKYLKTLKG